MSTKIALEDGHYPCIMEITGLSFGISIVMQSFDLTPEQQALRQQQADRLVTAWNAHDQLVAALKMFVWPYQKEFRLTETERFDEARAALTAAGH